MLTLVTLFSRVPASTPEFGRQHKQRVNPMSDGRYAKIGLQAGDALILVDVQNDFLPGGSLAVPAGNEVIPILNRYLTLFHSHGLPIFATRDWHPAGSLLLPATGRAVAASLHRGHPGRGISRQPSPSP